MTRRVRSFSAARRATAMICDREGTHQGQGLLLDIEDEGAVVLTCHHVTAQLPVGGIYVRLPGEDGNLGAPRPASYDEERSRPWADAVVLRLEGVSVSERPLLHELDPAEYSGNLKAIVITHLTTTSFSATISASTPINMSAPADARLPPGSRYVIPQAFRLANPTDARRGISGGVVVCDASVLGLAQSARKSSDAHQAEVYLLPLRVWAEGWEALSSLIETFAGATDPYDYALQDYLRALSIFSSNTPYLALDEILSGAKRALHDVYVPLHVRLSSARADNPGTGEEGEGKASAVKDSETSTAQDALPSKVSVKEGAPRPVETLADMLRSIGNRARPTHILLQGTAGTGKSTALRHIAEYAWWQPQVLGLSKPHLPIVVRLQPVADAGGASLEERLLNGIRRAADLPLERTPPEGFFREWSKRENAPWLLLLDGLDEVAAEDRGGILRWVNDLLLMLEGQHSVVLTSRPANDDQYEEFSRRFTIYDVLPFDEDQRADLARRWVPDTAEDFLAKVDRISSGDLFREPLEMTPLLLTIAAAVYRKNGDLPESGQVELYSRFIDILFEEARHKGLGDELGPGVFDVASSGLEKLALTMTERPTENTLGALSQVGAAFLEAELGWRGARVERRGRQFVEVMGRRSGVLYREGDSFQWVHPTLREYLAARALDRQIMVSGNDYSAVVGEWLVNENWYQVLWNLSLMHKDRAALIRWMSTQALTRFAANAALLAYDCWKDCEPSVYEALKADIIRALVGGLGDDRSGLSTAYRLEHYLTLLGRDATKPLLDLLNEYNGLQRQLLPEWNEKRKPDRQTEPGKRLSACYRLRYKIIKVLGDIGDETSVEPLISLLGEGERADSYWVGIAEGARHALRCIGHTAVGHLLSRISDTKLATQARVDCLVALRVVGIRTPAVTAVLDACVREGLEGNAELLASALRSATSLCDGAHAPRAISALSSDNKHVAAEAARYLSRFPDPVGLDDLNSAFAKWSSIDDDEHFVEIWTLKWLANALVVTRNEKAKKRVSNFIRSRLEDRDKRAPHSVLQLIDEVPLPNTPVLLLKDLVRRLNLSEQGWMVDRLVQRLGETWRPDQTRALVSAAKKYWESAAEEGDFVSRLVNACVGDREEGTGEENPLHDHLDRRHVLQMIAKCQVPNFVQQAGRLFTGAKFWYVSQLSDALWVVGNIAAEEDLIAALNNYTRPLMQSDRSMPEEYDIIRALGTCCTERGAGVIIDFVRDNPNISIYLAKEVLCTLVRRSVLEASRLARMALDETGTHEYVRWACVLALGYLDTPQFSSVFLQSVASESDERTRGQAAYSLGWAKTDRERAVKELRNLLETTDKLYLAEQAAKALARLKGRGSLKLIERAIERFGGGEAASELLRTAARFRAQSTLRLLENSVIKTRTRNFLHRDADIIAAFGEFYKTDEAAREAVDAQIENSHIGFDSGKQRIAVRVLAMCNPNLLLQRATQLYDEGRLDPSACTALINHAPRLSKSKEVDKTWLVEIMKRLLCEDDLPIREWAGESLQFLAAPLRPRIYNELRAMNSDWAQACAVYSLGFWDSDEKLIESARFDTSPVVRHLAATAAKFRSKRPDLHQIAQTFRKSRGLPRLSAYFSLLEQAGKSFIETLDYNLVEGDLARIYLRELKEGVEKRVKEDQKNRLKEEKDALCEKVRRVSFK